MDYEVLMPLHSAASQVASGNKDIIDAVRRLPEATSSDLRQVVKMKLESAKSELTNAARSIDIAIGGLRC
jgi:hypothetical protein